MIRASLNKGTSKIKPSEIIKPKPQKLLVCTYRQAKIRKSQNVTLLFLIYRLQINNHNRKFLRKGKSNQYRPQMLNFKCVFPSCNYKRNDIDEEEFLEHLKSEHHKEISETSKKESMPINMIEMMAVSNSKVFINS